MNKIKVRLDTQSDISKFVSIANEFEEDVYLEDGAKFRANAKSLLGVMYGMSEFKELYVISDDINLSNKFDMFMI